MSRIRLLPARTKPGPFPDQCTKVRDMPKLKSHKGILKRAKITRHGKVIVHHVGRRHLLSSKNAKRKRHLRRAAVLNAVPARRIKAMVRSH